MCDAGGSGKGFSHAVAALAGFWPARFNHCP